MQREWFPDFDFGFSEISGHIVTCRLGHPALTKFLSKSMKAVMVGPSSPYPCPQLDYVEGSFFSDVGDLSCVLYIG